MIPSQEWNKYRTDIERLYVTEDKSLHKVVEEMQRLHGFFATERQYKRKINKWRLDKYVKDEEMRAIVTRKTERQQQGKESAFFVRGRLVEPRKIDRFCLRKGIRNPDGDISHEGAYITSLLVHTYASYVSARIWLGHDPVGTRSPAVQLHLHIS